MNDIITIENTEMQIKEYNGQRVVTFKDIDKVHQNKSGTAKRNFTRNKKHFIEGEDYFLVTRENFKRDKLSLLNIDIPTRGVTVLTESGYLMIVKSLTDDLSWDVQRQLVNSYFKVKSINEPEEVIIENQITSSRYKCLTSKTPVPKNPNWFTRNYRRMKTICEKVNMPLSRLYYHILNWLSEKYNLDEARAIYEREVGYPPKYPIDIVTYFPDLGEEADYFIDGLEWNIAESQNRL